ncbi:unnamed protein product [Arctogadus glacialis]
MGPPAPPRLRAWTRWLLILGCMAGSSGSWLAAGPPQGDQRPSHAGRRPSPPVSVYRTPALLRGGHRERLMPSLGAGFTESTSDPHAQQMTPDPRGGYGPPYSSVMPGKGLSREVELNVGRTRVL